jgi:crotonobetainyl-CoA:carnitine CoA-transferase CaiB-like acyl-CoA transferase
MYDLQKRIMTRSGRLGVPLQECSDGWASMIALFDWDVFVSWLESVGEASDLADEKYKDMDYQIRPEVRQHITEVTDAFTKSHDKRWICEEGQKRHIIAIPCNNARDVVENRQLGERSFFVDVEHPELQDTLKYPGAPYRLGETPWRIGRRPPLAGEHNADIYINELGFNQNELDLFTERGII